MPDNKAMANLPEFDNSTSVESYLERLEIYFAVNKVTGDSRQHMLLMGLKGYQYDTIRDLAAPHKPKDLTYSGLVDLVCKHFGTSKHWLVERLSFREMRQNSGENLNEYVSRLKSTARQCEFASSLDVNLVEQFLHGMWDTMLRSKLIALEESKLTDISVLLQEANAKVAIEQITLPDVKSEMNAVKRNCFSKGQAICGDCGLEQRINHKCPAKGRTCFKCGGNGHLAEAPACPKNNIRAVEKAQKLFDYEDDDSLF
ncbi:uncharacterized protein [Watersipora subatra]|uniref:uncharacterized protein n=1 Tax=Watersipora subatra TaxID=2589382 RepID=UPI00355BCA28